MKKIVWLLCAMLCMQMMGCAPVSGAAVESIADMENAADNLAAASEPVFETSFSRFDDRHEDHDYHFVIFRNTYGEYVLREDSASNAGEVVTADIFELIREIMGRNDLEQYDGMHVDEQDGQTMSFHASFDPEHPLNFTVESDPYAVWTEELLQLFTENLQSYEAPVEGMPQITLGESMCGRYLCADGIEGTDRVYEIFMEDGQLYLESRSIYDYWGAEFVPDEENALKATEGNELSGTWYVFSGFALAGSYWNGGIHGTLEKSSDGLVISGDPFGEGEHLVLVRNEKALPIHHVQERAESFDEKLIGIWRNTEDIGGRKADTFVRIERSGDVTIVRKTSGIPVDLRRGVILEGEKGVLRIGSERFAYGGMPYEETYTLKASSSMLELTTVPESDAEEAEILKLYPSEEGKRDPEISNGAGEGIQSELYIVSGFLDFDGSYILINQGNEVFYVDDASVLLAGDDLPGYLPGDTALTWVERMGDPLNPYTTIVGIYTVRLTGAHIDFIYGFGW